MTIMGILIGIKRRIQIWLLEVIVVENVVAWIKCNGCKLDMTIPCSPSCENLTEDGMIKIAKCLEDGCVEVKYIFDVLYKTNEEIIAEYGEIAVYPYDV